MKKLLLLLVLPATVAFNCARAQTTKKAKTTENDPMTQLLDLSRPGMHHAVIGRLSGTWNFQDAKLSFVKGTLVRKPFFDGRFYSVEITGGKLPLPVANGEMKEGNYRELQTEGYDNARAKYITISLNNHIGSDIQSQYGSYDDATKTFIYEWESELIPGDKVQNRRLLKIVDDTHYTEEYFELQNGSYIKAREIDYTKTGK